MKDKIMRSINIFALIVLMYALFVINCKIGDTNNTNEAIEHRVTISYTSDNRIIESTSIPSNFENSFPNSGNPNSPRNQNISVQLPLTPTKNSSVTAGTSTSLGSNYTETGIGSTSRLLKTGIAVDGVLIEPGTAEVWNETTQSRTLFSQVTNPQWSYDALGATRTGDFVGMDKYKGHVQPTGLYHYHSITSNTSLFEDITNTHSKLVAFAADGFPIFGPYGYDAAGNNIIKMYGNYKLKTGNRQAIQSQNPGNTYDGTFTQDYEFAAGGADVDHIETGDQTSILDEANGHTGKVPADELEKYKFSTTFLGTKNADNTYSIYHYHITQNYPYSPRKLYGVVSSSFSGL